MTVARTPKFRKVAHYENAPPLGKVKQVSCDNGVGGVSSQCKALALFIDLYSRRVVGWALGERLTAELVLQALWQAILIRQPPAGLLVHTDRGSQYTSDKFIALDQGNKLMLSMRGNCWDNAVAESFFNSLKQELVSVEKIRIPKQLRTSLTEHLDVYHNTVRMHSTLNYVSPKECENQTA